MECWLLHSYLWKCCCLNKTCLCSEVKQLKIKWQKYTFIFLILCIFMKLQLYFDDKFELNHDQYSSLLFFPLCVYPVAWKKKNCGTLHFLIGRIFFFLTWQAVELNHQFQAYWSCRPSAPCEASYKHWQNFFKFHQGVRKVWDWERGQTRGPQKCMGQPQLVFWYWRGMRWI